MGVRVQNIIPSGMVRDLAFGKHGEGMAYEIRNMRLNIAEDGSSLSWGNERGTERVDVKYRIPVSPALDFRKLYRIGTVLGHAVIGDRLVMFCKLSYFAQGRMMTRDCIISYNTMDFSQGAKSIDADVLYIGDLGFDTRHGIETVVCYENDDIQKVYWTDGLNQPRVINIAAPVGVMAKWTDDSFNFARKMALDEEISVEKRKDGTGTFPCGTIQYAVSYYDRHGMETNIAIVSDIHYITKGNRGGKSDETSTDSFKVTVRNIDKAFGYIRLYSIIRTTRDSKPLLRIVEDRRVDTMVNDVDFFDTNTTGRIVSSDVLLATGCETFVAQTMDTKDNTLFLGNIKLTRQTVPESVKKKISDSVFVEWRYGTLNSEYKRIKVNDGATGKVYSHSMQLDLGSFDITIFKYNEWYRFGLQFQHESGRWSEVVWVADSANPLPPDTLTNRAGQNRPALFQNSDVIFGVPLINCSDHTMYDDMYALGYRKVRPVVVYTNENDSAVIAQCVAAPTVRNKAFSDENSPYVQSSWFFRPNAMALDVNLKNVVPSSTRLQFGHDKCLGNVHSGETPYALEVQSDVGTDVNHEIYGARYKADKVNKSNWFVDREFITLHSPEIEYEDVYKTFDYGVFGLNIVGVEPITAFHSDCHVNPTTLKGLSVPSYIKHIAGWPDWNRNGNKPEHDIWLGCAEYLSKENFNGMFPNPYNVDVKYPVHVWSRDHLGLWDKNYTNAAQEEGMFSEKVFASIRYSYKPLYSHKSYDSLNVDDAKVFDSASDTVLKLRHGASDVNYMANINAIAPMCDTNLSLNNGTPYDMRNCYHVFGMLDLNAAGQYVLVAGKSSDPIKIKYRSRPHVVASLKTYNANGTIKGILPQDMETDFSFMYIVDIERGTVPNRFGGSTPEAIEQNVWVPCGKSFAFTKNNYPTVYGMQGDHYFMRYDCLKTMPYAEGDTNQVVEIGSFLLETRVNLDGRYDRMRGLDDNTIVTDENFGLVNSAYTQKDNYFTYMTLRDDMRNDNFPAQFTWSNTKTLGEETDTWTRIDLLNTSDADGALGPIRKIVNHNGNLVMFQDDAVARIPYNEKAASQTTEGMLNIAQNTGVGVVEYISRSIGAVNKWSVCNTTDNLYFIDDRRRKLYSLVGEDRNSALEAVSSARFFDSYFNDKVTGKEWTPGGWENFRLSYDRITNDLYMSGADGDCLALNDIRKGRAFTSFYDYGIVPVHANVAGMSLMFADGNMWRMHTGDYNSFFGKNEDSRMCIVSNGGKEMYAADKVFNNLEYRADMFDVSNGRMYTNRIPFTKIRTWNEYQDSGIVDADTVERFRIWHANIPRDNTHVLDRMRNPWLMIELTHVADGMELLLHDLMVYYDNR